MCPRDTEQSGHFAVGRIVRGAKVQFPSFVSATGILTTSINMSSKEILCVCTLKRWREFVSQEFFQLLTGLQKTYGVRLVEVDDFVKILAEPAKTVIVFELPKLIQEHLDLWKAYQGNRVFFAEDIHWFTPEERVLKLTAYSSCDWVIVTNLHRMIEWYPEIDAGRLWECPHAAQPQFAQAINSNPKSTILLSGAMHSVYPLRHKAAALKEQGFAIEHLPHPGYDNIPDDIRPQTKTATGYAQILNSHLACLTCGGVQRYVTAKHYEIAASGSLLVTDSQLVKELAELGFVAGVHYIATSPECLATVIPWILDPTHDAFINKIRVRCQSLVLNRHMVTHRVEFLGNLLTEIASAR